MYINTHTYILKATVIIIFSNMTFSFFIFPGEKENMT